MVSGKIDIELECTGRDLPLSECKTLNCEALLETGGHMVAERHGDRFRLNLTKIPSYARSHMASDDAQVIMGHAS